MRLRRNPTFNTLHGDHGIGETQLEYIQRRLSEQALQGFFIVEIGIPSELGKVPNALYGPESGDPPVRESDVFYMDRAGRGWQDRMVNWPFRWTDRVQAIGIREGDSFRIFTIYGGARAPQNANDPSNADPEGSRRWWSQHALSAQQWRSALNNIGSRSGGRRGRKNPMSFSVLPRHVPHDPVRAREHEIHPSARSIYSLTVQRKATEVMARTKHNFNVIIADDIAASDKGLPALTSQALSSSDLHSYIQSDAINLVVDPISVSSKLRFQVDKPFRESLYTAFAYLHRLGDVLAYDLLIPRKRMAPISLISKEKRGLITSVTPATVEGVTNAAEYFEESMQPIYTMLFPDQLPSGNANRIPEANFRQLIAPFVNSRMVREGYSSDFLQSLSDLVPLSEITSPSHSLFRPLPLDHLDVIDQRNNQDSLFMRNRLNHDYDVTTELINGLIPQLNTIFRTYFDLLLRSLYGCAIFISD